MRVLIGCPETSVGNFHYSLNNNPEESSSQPVMSFTALLKVPYTSFYWQSIFESLTPSSFKPYTSKADCNPSWSLCIPQIQDPLACLFLWTWDNDADVLLSDWPRCSLEACRAGFLFLIALIWLCWQFVTEGHIATVRYYCSLTAWLPIWIIYTEIKQRKQGVFVQWYCLMT
jgi:hypothetical protein